MAGHPKSGKYVSRFAINFLSGNRYLGTNCFDPQCPVSPRPVGRCGTIANKGLKPFACMGIIRGLRAGRKFGLVVLSGWKGKGRYWFELGRGGGPVDAVA